MKLKHVKLFEQFEPAQGYVAVGVVSEGTDVAIFSEEKAMEIKKHFDSISSDYYNPFFLKVEIGDAFVYINENAEAKLISEQELQDLMQRKQIIVFYANGNEEGEGMEGGYVIELIGNDKYMSIQSWNQGAVESGAFDHFLSFQSDEF